MPAHANILQGYILGGCTPSTCIKLPSKLDQARDNRKILTPILASEFPITTADMTSATAETTAQLQCMEQGGPFKIVHVPKPTLAPEEVLIRQRVIALNQIDAKQRDLGILIPRWPRVLGIEGAGIIEAVGSDVRDLQPGDEVMGWEGSGAHEVSWGGAFQERVAVPASFVAKKPKNIRLDEAASLP